MFVQQMFFYGNRDFSLANADWDLHEWCRPTNLSTPLVFVDGISHNGRIGGGPLVPVDIGCTLLGMHCAAAHLQCFLGCLAGHLLLLLGQLREGKCLSIWPGPPCLGTVESVLLGLRFVSACHWHRTDFGLPVEASADFPECS
jgi:hypothetical protein